MPKTPVHPLTGTPHVVPSHAEEFPVASFERGPEARGDKKQPTSGPAGEDAARKRKPAIKRARGT